MYNRNELKILLVNWGTWARGNTCPISRTTLSKNDFIALYDVELGLMVERAIISVSVKIDITPLILFYVHQKSVGSICQKMGYSIEKYTKVMEDIEDELSLIL